MHLLLLGLSTFIGMSVTSLQSIYSKPKRKVVGVNKEAHILILGC